MATVVAIITSIVVANATQTITTPNAALLHRTSPSAGITWTGLESACGGSCTSAITQGFSTTANTHIVYIDFVHVVDIKAASADTILIHNGDSITEAGNVTLVW